MKQDTKSILLNINADLFWKLHETAGQLGKTKTSIIRQSIARNLSFINQHELPLIRKLEAEKLERQWVNEFAGRGSLTW